MADKPHKPHTPSQDKPQASDHHKPKVSSEELGHFLEGLHVPNEDDDSTPDVVPGHEEWELPLSTTGPLGGGRYIGGYKFDVLRDAQASENPDSSKTTSGVDVPPHSDKWQEEAFPAHPWHFRSPGGRRRGASGEGQRYPSERDPEVAYHPSTSTAQDEATLAAVIEGEAGGEGPLGMQAVANVIANRARQNYGGHGGLVGQASAPYQFQRRAHPSATARAAAAALAADQLPDVTGGAIFYANPAASTETWARRLNDSNAYRIGRHYFTSNVEGRPFPGPYGDHISRHTPAAPATTAVGDRGPSDDRARHAAALNFSPGAPAWMSERAGSAVVHAPAIAPATHAPYGDQIARHMPGVSAPAVAVARGSPPIAAKAASVVARHSPPAQAAEAGPGLARHAVLHRVPGHAEAKYAERGDLAAPAAYPPAGLASSPEAFAPPAHGAALQFSVVLAVTFRPRAA